MMNIVKIKEVNILRDLINFNEIFGKNVTCNDIIKSD